MSSGILKCGKIDDVNYCVSYAKSQQWFSVFVNIEIKDEFLQKWLKMHCKDDDIKCEIRKGIVVTTVHHKQYSKFRNVVFASFSTNLNLNVTTLDQLKSLDIDMTKIARRAIDDLTYYKMRSNLEGIA